MPLLTREEIHIYNSHKLNEKAVNWDDSFLGALTKGLGNAFSWIGGKAAKGWKKMRLDSLVMQYGAEYVKALRAVDLNINVDKDFPVDQAGSEFDAKPDEAKPDDAANPDGTPAAQAPVVEDDVKKDIADLEKLIILGLYNSEFKKHFSNKNMVNLKTVKDYLETFLDSIQYDDELYLSKMNNALKYKPADGILEAFNRLQFIIKTMWDLNEDSDLYQRLQKEYPKELEKLVPNESKWSELKSAMGNLVMGSVNKLAKYIYQCSLEMQDNTREPKSKDDKPQVESMLREAKELKIPKSVQELMSPEDIAKFEKMPDIKKKTLDKMNTKALSTIKYEAEHIINKAKKKADYDMKSKDGSTDADDLQRDWEVGIKNIDNYFQKVIDVTKVGDLVKKDLLPDDIKKTIESTDEAVDMVPKLGLQSLSPVNAKFINKGLYAFNINLRGQNNSVLKEAYIITSPTAEYVDAADNGKTYYWHKIFGQYKFDEKTNTIVRLNPFEKLTRSRSIIDNFKNKENQYFLVFESMRVSKKASNVWIYSNKGGAFYDGKVIPDVNTILEDVKRNNTQSWLSIGNLFRIIVNARFTVDTNDLKRFPGIQQADIMSETGTKEANANHDLIINNLPQK